MDIMADDLTDVFIWYSQNLEQVPAELQANVTKLLSVGLPELNSPVKLSDLISSEDLKTVTEFAPTSQRDLRKMLSTQIRADDKLKRVDLRKMTIPELRTLAKEHSVTVPSNLTKREIINILMKSEKNDDTHRTQSGGGLVDGNVKLLALIKLDELAVRHQLIEPGRQLPDHCQQAVRDNFERAEHEAQRILTNQSGGAVSPVVIGAIALGSLTLVAIVIYIYRVLRGRTTAQPPRADDLDPSKPYMAYPPPPPPGWKPPVSKPASPPPIVRDTYRWVDRLSPHPVTGLPLALGPLKVNRETIEQLLKDSGAQMLFRWVDDYTHDGNPHHVFAVVHYDYNNNIAHFYVSGRGNQLYIESDPYTKYPSLAELLIARQIIKRPSTTPIPSTPYPIPETKRNRFEQLPTTYEEVPPITSQSSVVDYSELPLTEQQHPSNLPPGLYYQNP